jgi:UDP-N-acetylglucosamine--dolichyl-phosphate N-acetylglucosaminephosphotransferase
MLSIIDASLALGVVEPHTHSLEIPDLRLLHAEFRSEHVMAVLGLSALLPVFINLGLASVAFLVTLILIQSISGSFVKAGLHGRDLNKVSREPVPEGLGVVAGAVYLVIMFLFIPVPFAVHWWTGEGPNPHEKFDDFVSALLSICCMIFLGFSDDVLNLPWRHKLTLPTMASLPLLMAYLVNIGSTTIIIPKPIRFLIGYSHDLGVLYYVYMGMLAVFCTNAINILAGINGVEAGQSLIIAISIALFNMCELFGDYSSLHLFSLFIILPFIGVTAALFYHNWYPSSVFVGDTFCYFAGMTFAVVGILGHFSKTVLLFFIPQIINFAYSTPQLFRLIPCPRHRLPKYEPTTDRLSMSYAHFKKSELNVLGHLVVQLLQLFRLASVENDVGEDGKEMRINNLTLINFIIKLCGPMKEQSLTIIVLCLQVFGSIIAFFIRYELSLVFYDN